MRSGAGALLGWWFKGDSTKDKELHLDTKNKLGKQNGVGWGNLGVGGKAKGNKGFLSE